MLLLESSLYPSALNLQAFLVFSQHPAWVITLVNPYHKKCVLLLKYPTTIFFLKLLRRKTYPQHNLKGQMQFVSVAMERQEIYLFRIFELRWRLTVRERTIPWKNLGLLIESSLKLLVTQFIQFNKGGDEENTPNRTNLISHFAFLLIAKNSRTCLPFFCTNFLFSSIFHLDNRVQKYERRSVCINEQGDERING